MFLNYFLSVFKKNKKKDAIAWKGKVFTYEWLIKKYNEWCSFLDKNQITAGKVVVIQADFSPNSITLLLALIEKGTIIVPMAHSIHNNKKKEFIKISQGEVYLKISKTDEVALDFFKTTSDHTIYSSLRNQNRPGLVLFSSGSTGKSKASVHDLTFLLEKFTEPRHSLISINFLLYDHIGGFNTLFYMLSNAGLIVTVQERNPNYVLKLIQKYKVELLPTSPTFLNLVLISEEYKNFNLSSLKMITYGTEPMPQSTLKRLNKILPDVKFLQTYGLSEVGILRSKSKNSESLWVKVGGEGYKTRIVDGMLEIKSKSAMLGYLNAPNPFTKDGWFKTGDKVVKNGEYIKILGRKSEIINVGGEKVYPQEVEDVILNIEGVADVVVYGEKNPIIGNIVCAKISLINKDFDSQDMILRIKKYCKENLEKYKTPVRILINNTNLHNPRFKKMRN
jgi:long-chain acyl-CoA synthetase